MKVFSYRIWKTHKKTDKTWEDYHKRKPNVLSISLFGKSLVTIYFRDNGLEDVLKPSENPFTKRLIIYDFCKKIGA